jgi:hypothetical protein
MAGGTYIEPSRTTLAAYLVVWLKHSKTAVAPRTHERYAEIVAQYINPALGSIYLTKLQPMAIAAGYDAIKGSRTKGRANSRTAPSCTATGS